jgi:hypothetical protein
MFSLTNSLNCGQEAKGAPDFSAASCIQTSDARNLPARGRQVQAGAKTHAV